MTKICIILIAIIILNLGCQKQKTGTVVARAGDSELTLEEVKNQLGLPDSVNNEQLQKYILNWVNEELLYQEAQRKGINQTKQFQNQMHSIQRQLAIQQLIDELIFNDSIKVSDSTALDYFNKNQSEFFIQDDLIKINEATFDKREQAAIFSSQVSKGLSWGNAIEKFKTDSTLASSLVRVVTGKYFSLKNIYPQEIWKVAMTLGTNEVSFPIKVSDGYSVIQLLARKKKGDPSDFEIVHDEVIQRIIIENKRKTYSDILSNLRKKYKVEILLSHISSPDTLQK